MMGGLELSGPAAGFAVLALPYGALLVVMAVALRRIARRRSALEAPPAERYASGTGPGSGLSEPSSVGSALQLSPPRARGIAAGAALLRQISEAENANLEGQLPELYLLLAREKLDGGESAAALQALTQCIRLAAKLGSKATQAAARLELGDLSRTLGDLTSACEHWQIARALSYELKNSGLLEAAEIRMRRHGCPTDWVLNDF